MDSLQLAKVLCNHYFIEDQLRDWFYDRVKNIPDCRLWGGGWIYERMDLDIKHNSVEWTFRYYLEEKSWEIMRLTRKPLRITRMKLYPTEKQIPLLLKTMRELIDRSVTNIYAVSWGGIRVENDV
jgi:hypothetical protein